VLIQKAQEDELTQELADEIGLENSEGLNSSSTSIVEQDLAKDPLLQPTPNNCPDYINCMPTIGGPARNCAIPPGCEGITQIVW